MALKLNFEQFQKELEKEIKDKQEKLNENAREIVLTAYNQVQKLSPVDKGVFRASHFVTKNNLTNEEGKAGEESNRTSEARDILSQDVKNGDKIYIQNNLPYAQSLENGTSKQAPNGVYGIVEQQVKTIIQNSKRQSV